MKPALIAIPVGLVLLAGASLKFWHFLAGGAGLNPAWLDPLIILFELTLGGGLVVKRSAGLWPLAVVTFAVFVGFNLHALWVGQASCGCFGSVAVSPWSALALDLGVLIALALWAVFDPDVRATRRTARDAAGFLTGYATAAAVWLAVVSVGFGSTAKARAALRGDRVVLESPSLDFGAEPVSAIVGRPMTITNVGTDEVRVVGGTSNCSCTLIDDLPFTIPPGESRQLLVRMAVPPKPGAYQIHAVLWTDSATNDTIPVLLRGRSVGP